MKYYEDEEGNVFQLQRCPFCGMEVAEVISQRELWDDPSFNADRYTVVCSRDNGGCGGTCGFHGSKQKAVSRWNTRVVI